MNLLDLMREPAVKRPIDPNGHVVQGPALEQFCWRKGYRSAEIELHPDEDGLWMWSASYSLSGSGSGYKVGRKWGRFARNRDDALYYAVEELAERLERRTHVQDEVAAVLTWARGLK
ncbi:MAG: hypothetical protein QHC89_01785 [Bosea sp. (in: a-proteobacteria)]|nr:hypothetical protein [Bosea sp. (in: a-proteobacteria)]